MILAANLYEKRKLDINLVNLMDEESDNDHAVFLVRPFWDNPSFNFYHSSDERGLNVFN